MLRSSIADIFEPRNELADFDKAVLDIGILSFSSGSGLKTVLATQSSSFASLINTSYDARPVF